MFFSMRRRGPAPSRAPEAESAEERAAPASDPAALPEQTTIPLVVFTQDERVYLPLSLEPVVDRLGDRIECIVLSPPMSTHGGNAAGLKKHLSVFGLRGSVAMGVRVVAARLLPLLGIAPRKRRAWSIEALARAAGIPVHHVDKVNSASMHEILDRYQTGLLISVSCPQIIRKKLLSRFEHGGLNVHSSPLPRYRGLMPAFWLLFHDEQETAVTVHDLAEQLDDGDIRLQQAIPIRSDDTWNTLVTRTKTAAGDSLVEAVEKLERGDLPRRANPDDASSYFSFPSASDAREFRRRGRRMF